MKAIEYLQYGGPEKFQLNDLVKPEPKCGEVLIKVMATTVTAADTMMRKGKPYFGRLYLGITKPKRTVLGFEFAGEITEVGGNVSAFQAGDRVFGGTTKLGCYAEYVCINQSEIIAKMPENLSFEEASPVSGSAITVMNFLIGKAKMKAGDKVLINGASGGLGTYAVQIAKHFGAEVTGVCSTSNIELARKLGADNVIDYTSEDFTQNGLQYDIIFDTVGKRSFSQCKNSLTQTGVYLSAVINLPLLFHMMRTAFSSGKKARSSATGMVPVDERLAYFLELKTLLKKGEIRTVIGKQYTFAGISEAHAYVEKGHKLGNLVITM